MENTNTVDNIVNNTLDIPKPACATRVAAAMSGGVDSAVVAAMLAREGYDVIGLTMQLYDHGAARGKKGACCAGRDVADARRVAATMGFAHYVLDYESLFKTTVIDEFVDSYLGGATPVPCIRCNERVKFKDLLKMAQDLDADCLATGHYVQRKMGANGPELHCATDPNRDQSYFLFATTREQLAFLRFPLGGVKTKAETRKMASELGLDVADKPDSQDICFVPDGRYADLIEKLRPGAAEPGDIVHIDGRRLGRHEGVLRFTIGQRRGLNLTDPLSPSQPLYVIKLDADHKCVVVGPREALASTHAPVAEINWLGDGDLQKDCPADGWDVEVKVRSTRPPRPARIYPRGTDTAIVSLATPEEGIAPGQACVFYAPDSSRVLGGGWLQKNL
jgi:tRNA-specific 2-thiouridylase